MIHVLLFYLFGSYCAAPPFAMHRLTALLCLWFHYAKPLPFADMLANEILVISFKTPKVLKKPHVHAFSFNNSTFTRVC